jgi:glutamate 5-kinase
MILPSKNPQRILIKIGSNVLKDVYGLRKGFFSHLAGQMAFLVQKGMSPILVSSGAIATAMAFLHKKRRPDLVSERQAYAAIGQPILMNEYARVFKKRGLHCAQILLTKADLEDRQRSLNAKHAIDVLIAEGIVPIINENDTVSVDEIKIGDNDQLSAYVAHLVRADLVIILSHVDGLYDANPASNKNAQLIRKVTKIDTAIRSLVFSSRDHNSVGGMATKLKAAQICLEQGIPLVITSGFRKRFIEKTLDGTVCGTFFAPI